MLQYKNSQQFRAKTRNFPVEVYRIDDTSTHIFKYMFTLLELGLGQLCQWQDEASGSESMAGTKFNDLDALFAFLGVTRLPGEIYPYDAYADQLTSDQWNEVYTKDALYRIRIVKFFQALLRGGTLEGLQMAAEAASGVRCQVFEIWRVISGHGLAAGLDLERDPALGLAKEFVIVPLEEIDDGQRVAIIHLVEILKPVNTISTVYMSPTQAIQELEFPFSASEDYFFEVRKLVTASDDLLFGDPDIWIDPNEEVEAPTFALMSTHDSSWSLNEAVTTVKAFQLDEQFLVAFAILAAAINSSVTSIVADEADEPGAPAFSIKIDSEQMFVTDRVPVVGSNTQYTYTVLRAQNGTSAASHLINAEINSGIVAFAGADTGAESQFGPWTPIPLADSPDNFPEGQFSGDQSHYDSNGNYIYDYPSQSAYVEWFTHQIQLVGGETTPTQYRLPVAADSLSQALTLPTDSLAPPEISLQTRVYPKRST